MTVQCHPDAAVLTGIRIQPGIVLDVEQLWFGLIVSGSDVADSCLSGNRKPRFGLIHPTPQGCVAIIACASTD